MGRPWTAWISSEDLGGLVGIEPEVSGLPVYVWVWSGGLTWLEMPLVFVAHGPSLIHHPVAVVQVVPEVVVLTGPLIEAEQWMPALAAWLEANAAALASYWWHRRSIYWPGDLLRDLRRAGLEFPMAVFHADVTDEEAVVIAEGYAVWLEGRTAVERHEVSVMRRIMADLTRRGVPKWRLGEATKTWAAGS